MNYLLENSELSITIRSLGAELTSIKNKKDNLEYLWCGDEAYWKYHAPVLFPIVGKVKNNEYRLEDKHYNLNQHGFARLCDFTLYEKKENYISFKLEYNDELLKIYPFKFALIISYILEGNTLRVNYTVENLEDKAIYFSIGGHPAFLCPLLPGESFEDYQLRFNKKEDISLMQLTNDGYYLRDKKDFAKNTDIIPLNLELFKVDALVFSNTKSSTITIENPKHDRSITMDFSEFPYLGVWTMKTGAPFLCLEPWQGHADYDDFSGDFKEKPGVLSLESGKIFNCGYDVIIK